MKLLEIQESIRQEADRSSLAELMKLQPGRVLFDILLSWVAIIIALVLCSQFPSIWMYLIAFVIIGLNQYALFIIGHDGLHGSIHPAKKWNDAIARWLVYGPMFMGFEDGKRNHLEHHKQLGCESDPDRYLHTFQRKDSPIKFLLYCSGIATFAQTVIKVSPFGKRKIIQRDEASKSNSLNSALFKYVLERIPVLLWQPIIISFMLLPLHLPLWAYPALWIAPIYFFVFVPDEIRAFCDHAVLDQGPAAEEHRLVTFVPPLIERIYFSPHEMNYHAEHHLWTRIPYYNLPRAHQLVKSNPHITVRNSYLRFLGEVVQFLRK